MNLMERNGDIQYLIELEMRNRSKQEKLNRHQRRKEGRKVVSSIKQESRSSLS